MARLTEKEMIAIVKEVTKVYDFSYSTEKGGNICYSFCSQNDILEIVDRSTEDNIDIYFAYESIGPKLTAEIVERAKNSQQDSLLVYSEQIMRQKIENIVKDTFSASYIEKNQELIETQINAILFDAMKKAHDDGTLSKKQAENFLSKLTFDPVIRASTHYSYNIDYFGSKRQAQTHEIKPGGCYWVRMPRHFSESVGGGEARPAVVVGVHPETDSYYVAAVEHKKNPTAEDVAFIIGNDADGRALYLANRPLVAVGNDDVNSFVCQFDEEKYKKVIDLLQNNNKFSVLPGAIPTSLMGNSKHDKLVRKLNEYEKNYKDPTDEELKKIVSKVFHQLQSQDKSCWNFASDKNGKFKVEVSVNENGMIEIQGQIVRYRDSLPFIVTFARGQKTAVYTNFYAFRQRDYAKIHKTAFDSTFTKAFMQYQMNRPDNEMFVYAAIKEAVRSAHRSYLETQDQKVFEGCKRTILKTLAILDVQYDPKGIDSLITDGLEALDLSKIVSLRNNESGDDGDENGI